MLSVVQRKTVIMWGGIYFLVKFELSQDLSDVGKWRYIAQSCEYNSSLNRAKHSSTFLILFSNKMLIFRVLIHKMLARIANREDPDQTASSEAVWSGYALFV